MQPYAGQGGAMVFLVDKAIGLGKHLSYYRCRNGKGSYHVVVIQPYAGEELRVLRCQLVGSLIRRHGDMLDEALVLGVRSGEVYLVTGKQLHDAIEQVGADAERQAIGYVTVYGHLHVALHIGGADLYHIAVGLKQERTANRNDGRLRDDIIEIRQGFVEPLRADLYLHLVVRLLGFLAHS